LWDFDIILTLEPISGTPARAGPPPVFVPATPPDDDGGSP